MNQSHIILAIISAVIVIVFIAVIKIVWSRKNKTSAKESSLNNFDTPFDFFFNMFIQRWLKEIDNSKHLTKIKSNSLYKLLRSEQKLEIQKDFYASVGEYLNFRPHDRYFLSYTFCFLFLNYLFDLLGKGRGHEFCIGCDCETKEMKGHICPELLQILSTFVIFLHFHIELDGIMNEGTALNEFSWEDVPNSVGDFKQTLIWSIEDFLALFENDKELARSIRKTTLFSTPLFLLFGFKINSKLPLSWKKEEIFGSSEVTEFNSLKIEGTTYKIRYILFQKINDWALYEINGIRFSNNMFKKEDVWYNWEVSHFCYERVDE